jgi:endonuclease G
MSAAMILGILLLLVVVGALVYFAWRGYQQRHPPSTPTAQTAPATTSATPPSTSATAPATPSTTAGYAFGGLPLSPLSAPVTILQNRGYISGYSEQRRDPLFVCYRVLNVGHVDVGPRPAKFKVDPRSTSHVQHEDYSGSGYDRGHMAPNHAVAKCYGQQAQDETFFVTNICPQTPTLNQKVWESLEHLEAEIYPARYGDIYVTDGPIFDENPKTIGIHRVQVPVAFYKILLENKSGTPTAFAVIMPQNVVETDRNDLAKFVVPIRAIESRTGLNFFPELPPAEQDRLETTAGKMW